MIIDINDAPTDSNTVVFDNQDGSVADPTSDQPTQPSVMPATPPIVRPIIKLAGPSVPDVTNMPDPLDEAPDMEQPVQPIPQPVSVPVMPQPAPVMLTPQPETVEPQPAPAESVPTLTFPEPSTTEPVVIQVGTPPVPENQTIIETPAENTLQSVINEEIVSIAQPAVQTAAPSFQAPVLEENVQAEVPVSVDVPPATEPIIPAEPVVQITDQFNPQKDQPPFLQPSPVSDTPVSSPEPTVVTPNVVVDGNTFVAKLDLDPKAQTIFQAAQTQGNPDEVVKQAENQADKDLAESLRQKGIPEEKLAQILKTKYEVEHELAPSTEITTTDTQKV